MRLVYVNPATANNDWETCPPLGSAYLMACVRGRHPSIEQTFIDFTVDPRADQLFASEALGSDPPAAVLLSFMTPQAPAAYDLTRVIRDRWGDRVPVIHGGCHATPRPADSLLAGADVVVLKEGEDAICDLLPLVSEAWPGGRSSIESTSGLVLRGEDGESLATSPRQINEDLDRLPFPFWDAFKLPLYSQDLHVIPGKALPLLTSRGCPANCYFCSSPFMWDRRMRYRCAASVVDEMEAMGQQFGVRHFHFYDDDFLVSRRHVTEVTDELRRRGLRVQFLIQARTDSIIRLADRLPDLRAAGCAAVELGVESADEVVLVNQNKRETRDRIRQAIALIRLHGLRLASCNIIACNPGETIRGHYLHNQFLHEVLGLDRIFIGNYLTLFPGSYFGDHPGCIAGRNLATAWGEYCVHDVTFVPESLAKERPVATQPELTPADLILLLPVLARADQVAGADLASRVQLRRALQTIYRLFDGTRMLDEAAGHAAVELQWRLTRALKVSAKLMIACAQVGLVATADQPEFFPTVPPWYAEARRDPAGWYRSNKQNMFYFGDPQ